MTSNNPKKNEHSLEKTNFFKSGRYRVQFKENAYQSFCIGGSYTGDQINVEDTQSHEKISLSFRSDTKKLVRVYRTIGSDFSQKLLSLKEFNPHPNTKEAYYKQRSVVPDSLEKHEIYYDETGAVYDESYSSDEERVFHDFIDEQAFMAVVQEILFQRDDAPLSDRLKEQRNKILGYFEANMNNLSSSAEMKLTP